MRQEEEEEEKAEENQGCRSISPPLPQTSAGELVALAWALALVPEEVAHWVCLPLVVALRALLWLEAARRSVVEALALAWGPCLGMREELGRSVQPSHPTPCPRKRWTARLCASPSVAHTHKKRSKARAKHMSDMTARKKKKKKKKRKKKKKKTKRSQPYT